MGGQELSMKFSNDIYATKQDVIREMKTTLVDGIWTEILKYRSNFNQILKLKHIDSTAYFVCMTPTITNKINEFDRKLFKLASNYNELEKLGFNREFDFLSKMNILETVSKLYQIDINKATLYSIANGSLNNVPPEQMILTRFAKCIDEISQNPFKEVDENTIGIFYTELLGNDNITEYYRTKDFDNKFSKYITGKVYLGIPHKIIEKSMDQLLSFIQISNNLSPFITAISTFYYIYYVKPFETHNEEIAVLMLKKILSNSSANKVSALLNFESLLLNKDELEKVIFEVQRSYDLTYFINYCFETANKLIDFALDDIVTAQNTGIKHDFYQADPIAVEKVEEPLNVEPGFMHNPDNFNYEVNNKEEISEAELEKIVPASEPVAQREETPVVQIDKEVQNQSVVPPILNEERKSNDAVQTFAHETVQGVAGSTLTFAQNIAINVVPAGLDEEEAAKLENHLLELNPSLSRGQAYFYARHCTIGMCYTISQYKKEVGCAYETARSSMDHLVAIGYYAKKQLKNKYIYTPVKRGRGKNYD